MVYFYQALDQYLLKCTLVNVFLKTMGRIQWGWKVCAPQVKHLIIVQKEAKKKIFKRHLITDETLLYYVKK